MSGQEPTPEEREAIRLRWEAQGGVGEIPPQDAERLLQEVRQRQAQIEQHVLQDLLIRRTSEGRRYPRRHQRFALVVLLFAILIIALVISLGGN